MVRGDIEKARESTLSKPVIRSAAATHKLASSLLRLGVDEQTVARLAPVQVRPSR